VDLGQRALKNIEQPVHAYQVLQGGNRRDVASPAEAVSGTANVDLSLQQRPSLALLPFRNLNGDIENDFIADGISLGIQTLLVQLSGMFMINAVSIHSYRSGEKTAADVVRDLPVRFVLEGTTQRSGQRVRVTAQLTDLRDSVVVWAERYDRELEDIFALQDDITRQVTSSLNAELNQSEFLRIWTRDLKGHGAWEYFLRGVSHLYKFTKDDNLRAREMFIKLYDLHPEKVHGPSYIALTHWIEATTGWAERPAEVLKQAAEWATKAVSYEYNDGLGHVIMSDIRLHEGRHDEALALCEQAVEYRTNCPAALGQEAAVRLYCGDAPGAAKSAREGMMMRQMLPPVLINLLATAYRDNGQIELSIPAAREAIRLDPAFTDGLVTLYSDYVLAGDNDEARRIADEILAADPEFRISNYLAKHPYRDKSKLEQLAEALHAAGLPE
jgi:TolB-like protein